MKGVDGKTIKLSPLWMVFLIKLSSFLISHFQLNHLNPLERECCHKTGWFDQDHDML